MRDVMGGLVPSFRLNVCALFDGKGKRFEPRHEIFEIVLKTRGKRRYGPLNWRFIDVSNDPCSNLDNNREVFPSKGLKLSALGEQYCEIFVQLGELSDSK